MLEFTIGFIQRGGDFLLLNRKNAPMQGVWHGVGGKLERGEDPHDGMLREMLEETGIRFKRSQLRFAGIVTWNGGAEGMYAYVAELDESYRYPTPIEVDEGILAWKPLEWICSPDNKGVVEHVKRFLPMMLFETLCFEYRCEFKSGKLTGFAALPLNEDARLRKTYV